MFRALKRFDHVISGAAAVVVSLSILCYMIDDNCRLQKKRITDEYDSKILNYETEINNLKEIIAKSEKNNMK